MTFTTLKLKTRLAVALFLASFFVHTSFSQNALNYTHVRTTNASLAADKNGNTISSLTSLMGNNQTFLNTALQSIGFDFFFMGKRFTHFVANSGGGLALGLGNSPTTIFSSFGVNDLTLSVTYPPSAGTAPVLAPFWDNLATAVSGATVRTALSGTAPNRCRTIEWNVKINLNSFSTNADGVFQARLYEGTGEIEYVYGRMVVGSGASTVTASIGFTAGTANNSFKALKNLSTYDFTSIASEEPATQSLINSSVAQTIFGLSSTADGSRSRFTFTPVVANGSFSQLSFSNIGFNNITLNWADNITNESQYAIYRSTDNINFTFVDTAAANSNSYTASNLIPNTTYYWRVIAVAEGNVQTTISGQQTTKVCAMTGVYKIGPGGQYPTIQAAIDSIVANGTAGAVILELNQLYNPSVEAIPINFKRVNCTGPNSTITLRPEAGANGIKITTNLNLATFYFNGASFYQIDGRPGGTDTSFANLLTVENNNANNSAIVVENDSRRNTFSFLRIQGRNTQDTTGIFRVRASASASGNDSLRVENCYFTSVGNFFPKHLFYATGQPAGINDFIQLIGNNFSNHVLENESIKRTSAIYLGDNNNRCVIRGNSFYQTANRSTVYATFSDYNEVYVENTDNGGSHIIDSNYFGGLAPKLGGAKWVVNSQLQYTGIYLKGKQGQVNTIHNNAFANIRYEIAVEQRGYTAIEVYGPVTCSIANNTIGNPAIDSSITITSPLSATNTDFKGIVAIHNDAAVSDSIVIRNNTIASVWAGFGVSGFVRVVGIQTNGIKNLSIRNNIIGSTSNNNSIANATNATLTGMEHNDGGNANGQALNVSIAGNTISGLSSPSTGIYNNVRGIYISGMASTNGNINVTGNTVQNMFTASNMDATGSLYSSLVGITSESPVTNISKNTVKNLQNLPAAGNKVTIVGIDVSQFNLTAGTRAVPVFANLVHSLGGSTATAVRVSGIRAGNGNVKIYANMVRLGTTTAGTNINTPHLYSGIYIRYGFVLDVLHNSVAINGTGIPNNAASFSSYAFYATVIRTATVRVQNNIFTNFRSNIATAANYAHYAIGSDSVINKANQQYDYNIYYTSGINTKTGQYLGTTYDSLRHWKLGLLMDVNTLSANPNFVNTQGAEGVFDLHLQSPTPAEASGLPNLTTADFDGQNYNALTPTDLGADAGNFTWIDASPPLITVNNPLDSTGDLVDRILANVTITDTQTGVDNFTANNRPAIWFRKVNGNSISNWAYNFGTITSGSLNAGNWEFPITYSLLNIPAQPGDTIQYYVVAQDTANPINIGYAPFFGANHLNTDVQVSPPLQPYFYKLRNPLPVNLTVGTGQQYSSLTNAGGLFNAINTTGGLGGNTIVTISSNLTETGLHALNGIKMNGFSLQIKPAAATLYDIRNTTGIANKTFDLNGAKRLTIDGSFNGSGRYFQFVNGSQTNNATVFNIAGDCDSIVIRNCVIAANTADTATTANIVIGNGNNTNIVLRGNHILNSSPFVAYRKLTHTALLSLSTGNRLRIVDNDFSDFEFFAINLRNCGNGIVVDSNHFFMRDTLATLESPIRIIKINQGSAHLIRNNFIGGTQRFCNGRPFKYNTVFGSWFTDGITCISVNAGTAGKTEIKNNRIANFRIPYIMYKSSFIGIEANGTGEFDITGNTVGHDTARDNIYSEAGNASGVNNIGIWINTAGKTWVDNNLIANINNNYYSDQMTVTGIKNSLGTNRHNVITNNNIHHLYSASNGSGIYLNSGVIPVCGIDTRNIATIAKNSIHHLYCTDPSTEIFCYGLYASDPATSDTSQFGLIEKNRIYEINNAGSSQGNNSITGLKVHDGKWNIINNQILINNAPYVAAIRVQGLDISEFVPGEKRVLYNTIAVGGNNGPNFDFSNAAFITTNKGIVFNNIFYNSRKGTGKHTAFNTIWQTGSTAFQFDSSTCDHNLFATVDSASVITYGYGAVLSPLQAWRNVSGADRNSYFYRTDSIPMLAYFADTAMGNLNINNLNPYCWTVNGKGKPIAGVGADFDADNVRSTGFAGGSTDIGSDEFSTTTTPPLLRVSGNHVPGGADTLRMGTRIMAIINWGNTGSLPQLGNARYYSGQWPNDITNGGMAVSNAQSLNAWWDIPASGGSGFTYSITLFFDSSIIGKVTDLSTLLLHKKQSDVTGTWQALPTIINLNNNTVTATGLTGFSEFTATSKANPIAYIGNEICNSNNTSFSATVTGAGYTYQWQADDGTGFVNIADGSVYSGATAATLNLTAPPSSLNGTRYRCITNTGSGNSTSPTYSLKITNRWTGAASTDWNNTANWSCGQLPDANTDVTINAGLPNYPVVLANVACRRLVVQAGANITIGAGVTLDITGK